MSAAARYIGLGSTLIVLGLLISFGWYFSHHRVTHGITTDQIRDAIVVESTSSKGYYDWKEGNALNNPNYYVFYMWNITNPENVTKGEPAEYQQVGPYYYQYIWYNENATFLDNGNIVEYNLIEDYIYIPKMSASDPTQDLITAINPAYVTILSQAGGDDNMITMASLPVISWVLDFLTGEYVNLISSQYAPGVLADTLQTIYSDLENILSYNQTQAEQYFLSFWANEAEVPPYFLNFPGIFPTVTNESVIPGPTVAQLFSNHSFSLLDTSNTAIIYWLRASQNSTGPEAQALSKTFTLTPAQLEAVLLWRNASFIPTYVQPVLISQAQVIYPIATLADVGWVQFVTTNFTTPSVADVYGTWYPQFSYGQFELGFFFAGKFTVGQAKDLLIGPYGLILNIENIGLFTAPVVDYSLWGVDATQATTFEFYLEALKQYGGPFVTDFINSGDTGLMITKSADYWLWRCVDPLVAFLAGPENAFCALQTNNTVQAPSQIFSGKNDLAQVGSYISWRNQTSVPFWNGTVNVSGCTDNGQFSPFLVEGQTLYVWDESFVKTLQFDYIGPDKVQNIDVFKYVMNQDAFAVSQLYTNTIEGFANETSTNQGAPIFLSNFDMYGANLTYANVSGMQPSSSDITTIYVEPNTGSTLQADEKLQVNIYYPPEAKGWNANFKQFKNIKTDFVYPLMKAWQQSSVSESQAKKLRQQLIVFTHKFNSGILWGLVSFGALLVVVGVILVAKGIKKRRSAGYHTINP